MALEAGTADLDKLYDVRQPLVVGPYTIKDLYPQGRPLTVREIFLHSSNVGAGMLALEAGAERQRAFLARLGLHRARCARRPAPVAPPLLPKHWGRIETITIGYGHGLAVAPLQFAAAVAAARQRRRQGDAHAAGAVGRRRRRDRACVSAATSARLREIMRLNVTNPAGHRPARRGRGLPRRRQDRHGRDAGPRRLSGEIGDLLLHRRLSHGCAQLRGAGDAVRAADRRGPRRPASPPASTPPPPRPASSSASRRCWASCRAASSAPAPGTASLTPHPWHNKKRCIVGWVERGDDPTPEQTRIVLGQRFAQCSLRIQCASTDQGNEAAIPDRSGDHALRQAATSRSPASRPTAARCGRAGCLRRIPGSKADGARFVPDAIAKGAAADPRQGGTRDRRAGAAWPCLRAPSRVTRWP